MNEWGQTHVLTIEVLTPLHVGSGRKLAEGFDFARHANRVYRLDVERILEDRWPDDPRQQQMFLTQPPAALLADADYTQHPDYFTYSLAGTPALREFSECTRDVHGRAYLPGTSLKGAIRTAILRAAIEREKAVLGRADIGRAGGPREAQRAGTAIERRLGGSPNKDLMRAVLVGDSAPAPDNAIRLQRIQMVRGLDVDVEAIAPGTRLTASLKVDKWLLDQHTREIAWSEGMRQLARRLPEAAMFIARRRLAHEYEYHQRRNDGEAARFYARLANEAVGQWPKNEFLTQVGYAAGWRAKSVLGGLSDDSELLERVVRDFRLDRGGGRESRGYTRGQPFPKARHLAYVGGRPALPMGWVRVKVEGWS